MEMSTVVSRGLKPLAHQASNILKPVAQTGLTVLKHALGHRASANVEPCYACIFQSITENIKIYKTICPQDLYQSTLICTHPKQTLPIQVRGGRSRDKPTFVLQRCPLYRSNVHLQ